MARPPRVHVSGAVYHVMARGNRAETVFEQPADRRYYRQLLGIGAERFAIKVHCYCIMPNHCHIVLSDPERMISRFMHVLGSSYGSRLRRERGWIGHVFAGRFKSLCVEREPYLAALTRYVHLNPCRARMVARPEDYPWSSYRDFVGLRSAPSWLDTGWILRAYGSSLKASRLGYRRFVESARDLPSPCPTDRIVAGSLAGSESFLTNALRDFPEGRSREDGATARNLKQRIMLDSIDRAVCRHYGITSIHRVSSDRPKIARLARTMFLWLAAQHTTATNRELTRHTGHASSSAVTHGRARVNRQLSENPAFRETWMGEAAKIDMLFKA